MMPLVIRADFYCINLDNSSVLKTDRPTSNLEHVAIKFEVILPKIVIKLTSNRYKLEKYLELFKETKFFQQTQLPFSNDTTTTTPRFSPLFEKHPYHAYLYNNPLSKKTNTLPEAPSASTSLHTYYTMTTDSLKKSAKYDIWNLNVENIYLDFTPSSSSDSIRLAKQNMIDTLSMTGWVVFDKIETNSWLNILDILEISSLLKLSQKQYTFISHLVDELEKFLLNNSSNESKITICLTIPTTFTLVIMDAFEDPIINHLTSISSSLSEDDIEPIMRNTSEANVVIDLITTLVSIIASIAKIEKPIPNKSLNPSRNLNEELDVDFDIIIFNNDFEEQQRKITRIELDDDSNKYNNENVPSMNVHINFSKKQLLPSPIITLHIQNHSLKIIIHAIDLLHKFSPAQTVVDIKPPIEMIIECMHIFRQIDGKVIVRKTNDNDNKKKIISSLSQSNSNDVINKKLQQLEIFRLENERLHSELNTWKTEICVLHSECDSLINTIVKLDIELTQAEYERLAQQQLRKK
ncbi:unnamed protein product [Rotaria sp. Silwood1]|nr:unnamed protein product [Rotaria sp. Silwood1]CAF4998048.1 unnamed protein product [Rotaria sp. Silwood1]